MTALKDPQSTEPQVLIEEARRRQRRRRASSTGLAALIALCLAILGLSLSGGPPSGNGETGFGSGDGVPATGTWHELSAPRGFIAPGARISQIVRYRGELVAAGIAGGTPQDAGLQCSARCHPAVWVSRTGASWRMVFAGKSNQGWAGGQQQLIAQRGGLLLLTDQPPSSKAGHGSPELWRSTGLGAWRRVRLPRAMASKPLGRIESDGRAVVVAGYGWSQVWSSRNGVRWS